MCPNLSAYRVAECQLNRIRLKAPPAKKGQAPNVTVEEQTHLDSMDRLWSRLSDSQKRMLCREPA